MHLQHSVPAAEPCQLGLGTEPLQYLPTVGAGDCIFNKTAAIVSCLQGAWCGGTWRSFRWGWWPRCCSARGSTGVSGPEGGLTLLPLIERRCGGVGMRVRSPLI